MTLPQQEPKILLIGGGLRLIENIIGTLEMISAELIFADTAGEGLRLMTVENPDLVVCEMQLPDLTASQLCRAIRSNHRLSLIPVIFAGDFNAGVNSAFDALYAGADDLFTEHFSAGNFIAKLAWVMEQRKAEAARSREFAALKAKQRQTLEIVRETSELFRVLTVEEANEVTHCEAADGRIEFGMNMIKGLAKIMEEQITTLESWFEAQSPITLANLDIRDRGPRSLDMALHA